MASSRNTFKAEDIKTSVDSKDVVAFGEFGCVRNCWHKDFGKIAANCFDVADTKSTEDIIRSAKEEATSLTEMKHENLQKVLGITTWGNYFALILEYTGGRNLERYLHGPKNSLDGKTKFKLVWQLISAINYLHNHDKGTFCHGDINPRNILLTSGGDVKLASFGLTSLIRKRNKVSVGMLATAGNDESMLYSAPEFLLGATLHPSADIYSFSMVSYEVLTEKKVYHDNRKEKLLLDIILLKTRPTFGDNECFDHDYGCLESTIEHCWKVESSERLTSKEIYEQLKHYAHDGITQLITPTEALTDPSPTRASAPLSSFVSPFQSVVHDLSVQGVKPRVDCQQITALGQIPSVLPHLVPTSDETTGAQNNDTILNVGQYTNWGSSFQPRFPSLQPFSYQPNMMSMGYNPYSFQQPGQTNMMAMRYNSYSFQQPRQTNMMPMGYNSFDY